MAWQNNPAFSCFIVVLDRKIGLKVTDIIPFQFMPKTVTDTKVAVYNDISIIARSTPLKSYVQSQARQITFTLDFFTAPQPGLGFIIPPLIRNRIDALRALTYPIYDVSGVKPPPRCLVRIGAQLSMIGVCKQVSVMYNNELIPWTLLPLPLAHGASITLSFEETLNIPLSYDETRMGYLPFSTAGNEFGITGALSGVGAASVVSGVDKAINSVGSALGGGGGGVLPLEMQGPGATGMGFALPGGLPGVTPGVPGGGI